MRLASSRFFVENNRFAGPLKLMAVAIMRDCVTSERPERLDDWKKEAQRAAAQAEAELEAERAAVAKRLTGKTVSPPK